MGNEVSSPESKDGSTSSSGGRNNKNSKNHKSSSANNNNNTDRSHVNLDFTGLFIDNVCSAVTNFATDMVNTAAGSGTHNDDDDDNDNDNDTLNNEHGNDNDEDEETVQSDYNDMHDEDDHDDQRRGSNDPRLRGKSNHQNNNKRNSKRVSRRPRGSASFDDDTYASGMDDTAATGDYGDDHDQGDDQSTVYTRDDDNSTYVTNDHDNDDNNTMVTDYTDMDPNNHNNNTQMANDASTAVSPKTAYNANAKPLASSFAKKCFFTKAGIGQVTQHYEGLTLNSNQGVILMLASAMKLKGCPTICDEDLRRVEKTYPNQFLRLPDELLLSSGWRRISKYCNFSNKPVADGVPFFRESK
jgi:hypothetical protein